MIEVIQSVAGTFELDATLMDDFCEYCYDFFYIYKELVPFESSFSEPPPPLMNELVVSLPLPIASKLFLYTGDICNYLRYIITCFTLFIIVYKHLYYFFVRSVL